MAPRAAASCSGDGGTLGSVGQTRGLREGLDVLGRGVVLGSLIGAVVVGVLRNGLTLMGVSSVYQVLVTGILLPAAKGQPQFMDNVLASAQGAITGEKFERFEVAFVGAGDTLSAALASLLAVGSDIPAAVGEALQFLDQSLDAGFRPGMGHVVPDRFFWALPPEDEEGAEPGPDAGGPAPDDFNAPDQTIPPGGSRRVH